MSLHRNPWGMPPPDDPPEPSDQRSARPGRQAGAPFVVWVFRWLAVIAVGIVVLDVAGLSREHFWGTAGREGARTTGGTPALMPALRPARPLENPPTLAGRPMTFEVVGRGGERVLLARGDFLPGTVASFEAALSRVDRTVRIVALDSPGGSVGDALALGRAIRSQGMSTRVEGGALCASACAYAFAGGVERVVERGAVVGVHQSAPYEDRETTASSVMSSTQYMTAQLLVYLHEMGVDAQLLTLALQTPHDKLYVLGRDELEGTGLTTRSL